jgi:hypothetical protein
MSVSSYPEACASNRIIVACQREHVFPTGDVLKINFSDAIHNLADEAARQSAAKVQAVYDHVRMWGGGRP